MPEEIKIEKLGTQGDGIGQNQNGKPVYVPFSLEGETVETTGGGPKRQLSKIQKPSPHRVEPVCKHYKSCGGCQLQHFQKPAYQEWKRQILVDTLSRAGIDTKVESLMSFETASRRRAVFSARQTHDGLVFGYATRESHQIISIDECPILVPEISSMIDKIKLAITPLVPARETTKVTVLACANGLDISVVTEKRVANKAIEQVSSQSVEILRISQNDEVVVEKQRPFLKFGDVAAYPTPGCFVQAIAPAEQAMADLVIAHLDGQKQVADLFCGIGTFALQLAKNATVLAIESEQNSLNSLDASWRAAAGTMKAIKTEKRDLFHRPLMAMETKKIGGVVFDPPRAGAEMQAKQLAKSKVKKIAAVSCNPTTLARDLEILVDGGYKITRVVPIDQFVFTPHLETVVLLER